MRVVHVSEREQFLKPALPVACNTASIGLTGPEIVPLGHRHDWVLFDPVAVHREAKNRSEPFEFLLAGDRAICPRVPEVTKGLEIQLLYVSKSALCGERLELLPEPAIFLEAFATQLARFG